jgi:ATP-dependent DNA helicase DinG
MTDVAGPVKVPGMHGSSGRESAPSRPKPKIPSAPVLIAGPALAVWLTADGEIETLDAAAASVRCAAARPYVCHAGWIAERLGLRRIEALDLLELFAFVRPARFVAPTPRGLAAALMLPAPEDAEAEAMSLLASANALLNELAARPAEESVLEIARAMRDAGWAWGDTVVSALTSGDRPPAETRLRAGRGFAVWDRLPEWEDLPPPGKPGHRPVTAEESRERLRELLGPRAEDRPQQSDYASAVSQGFVPRDREGEPAIVLAEAGTGVGKTLGYIAPASVWSEKNRAPFWISTYTRNLQHQVNAELDRLYPQTAEKRERVVVRKGRENYLCLLNFKEAVGNLQTNPSLAIPLGLMARWAEATRDGDMVGGDFPGWLVGIVGAPLSLGLTDRRGECIYAACPHYGRCFIEHSQRRARYANIVVANHALVLVRAALDGGEEGALPSHIVFDEGHHLFDAADSAYAIHLSGQEGRYLRRWLLGGEGARRGLLRGRGLERRIEDLIAGEEAREALSQAMTAARALPGAGWHQRLTEGKPRGSFEAFLLGLRNLVLARSSDGPGGYGLEIETHPLLPDIVTRARSLRGALEAIRRPLANLRRLMRARLDEEAESLGADDRRRIDAIVRGIENRALTTLRAWQDMLTNLEEDETPETFCDWFAVERQNGRELDVGYFRHWVDPMLPFARTLLTALEGGVITSATLTDGSGDQEGDWEAAEVRAGTRHLPVPAVRARTSSPFDHAAQSRILVVTDVARDDMKQVAAAYRALFVAADAGALGIFTAIHRLRAVEERLRKPLGDAGLLLLAQHVTEMDPATLVDIFRLETRSCLLGTDAMRDGVDVPGEALRLVVFDRVPWPRPDLIHKARRELFGGRLYDERLARRKLRQAYGRLIRRADDRGIFVMLDSRLPSRLLNAFPDGVPVERCGLKEALQTVRTFLHPSA